MFQRNLQQNDLHSDHDARLDEQCSVEPRTEPVENFEEGCDEHDEWDV